MDDQAEGVLGRRDEEVANVAATLAEIAVEVVESQPLDGHAMVQADLWGEARTKERTKSLG